MTILAAPAEDGGTDGIAGRYHGAAILDVDRSAVAANAAAAGTCSGAGSAASPAFATANDAETIRAVGRCTGNARRAVGWICRSPGAGGKNTVSGGAQGRDVAGIDDGDVAGIAAAPQAAVAAIGAGISTVAAVTTAGAANTAIAARGNPAVATIAAGTAASAGPGEDAARIDARGHDGAVVDDADVAAIATDAVATLCAIGLSAAPVPAVTARASGAGGAKTIAAVSSETA